MTVRSIQYATARRTKPGRSVTRPSRADSLGGSRRPASTVPDHPKAAPIVLQNRSSTSNIRYA